MEQTSTVDDEEERRRRRRERRARHALAASEAKDIAPVKLDASESVVGSISGSESMLQAAASEQQPAVTEDPTAKPRKRKKRKPSGADDGAAGESLTDEAAASTSASQLLAVREPSQLSTESTRRVVEEDEKSPQDAGDVRLQHERRMHKKKKKVAPVSTDSGEVVSNQPSETLTGGVDPAAAAAGTWQPPPPSRPSSGNRGAHPPSQAAEESFAVDACVYVADAVPPRAATRETEKSSDRKAVRFADLATRTVGERATTVSDTADASSADAGSVQPHNNTATSTVGPASVEVRDSEGVATCDPAEGVVPSADTAAEADPVESIMPPQSAFAGVPQPQAPARLEPERFGWSVSEPQPPNLLLEKPVDARNVRFDQRALSVSNGASLTMLSISGLSEFHRSAGGPHRPSLASGFGEGDEVGCASVNEALIRITKLKDSVGVAAMRLAAEKRHGHTATTAAQVAYVAEQPGLVSLALSQSRQRSTIASHDFMGAGLDLSARDFNAWTDADQAARGRQTLQQRHAALSHSRVGASSPAAARGALHQSTVLPGNLAASMSASRTLEFTLTRRSMMMDSGEFTLRSPAALNKTRRPPAGSPARISPAKAFTTEGRKVPRDIVSEAASRFGVREAHFLPRSDIAAFNRALPVESGEPEPTSTWGGGPVDTGKQRGLPDSESLFVSPGKEGTALTSSGRRGSGQSSQSGTTPRHVSPDANAGLPPTRKNITREDVRRRVALASEALNEGYGCVSRGKPDEARHHLAAGIAAQLELDPFGTVTLDALMALGQCYLHQLGEADDAAFFFDLAIELAQRGSSNRTRAAQLAAAAALALYEAQAYEASIREGMRALQWAREIASDAHYGVVRARLARAKADSRQRTQLESLGYRPEEYTIELFDRLLVKEMLQSHAGAARNPLPLAKAGDSPTASPGVGRILGPRDAAKPSMGEEDQHVSHTTPPTPSGREQEDDEAAASLTLHSSSLLPADAAVQFDPRSSSVEVAVILRRLGLALEATGATAEGCQRLSESIEIVLRLGPHSLHASRAHRDRGRLLLSMGRLAEAKEDLRRAVLIAEHNSGSKHHPRDVVLAYEGLGDCYVAANERRSACAQYEKALQLLQLRLPKHPDYMLITVKLMLCCTRLKNIGTATAHFATLKTLDPAFKWAYHARALIHMQRNEFDDAYSCFYNALECDPDYLDARYCRLILLRRMQRARHPAVYSLSVPNEAADVLALAPAAGASAYDAAKLAEVHLVIRTNRLPGRARLPEDVLRTPERVEAAVEQLLADYRAGEASGERAGLVFGAFGAMLGATADDLDLGSTFNTARPATTPLTEGGGTGDSWPAAAAPRIIPDAPQTQRFTSSLRWTSDDMVEAIDTLSAFIDRVIDHQVDPPVWLTNGMTKRLRSLQPSTPALQEAAEEEDTLPGRIADPPVASPHIDRGAIASAGTVSDKRALSSAATEEVRLFRLELALLCETVLPLAASPSPLQVRNYLEALSSELAIAFRAYVALVGRIASGAGLGAADVEARTKPVSETLPKKETPVHTIEEASPLLTPPAHSTPEGRRRSTTAVTIVDDADVDALPVARDERTPTPLAESTLPPTRRRSSLVRSSAHDAATARNLGIDELLTEGRRTQQQQDFLSHLPRPSGASDGPLETDSDDDPLRGYLADLQRFCTLFGAYVAQYLNQGVTHKTCTKSTFFDSTGLPKDGWREDPAVSLPFRSVRAFERLKQLEITRDNCDAFAVVAAAFVFERVASQVESLSPAPLGLESAFGIRDSVDVDGRKLTEAQKRALRDFFAENTDHASALGRCHAWGFVTRLISSATFVEECCQRLQPVVRSEANSSAYLQGRSNMALHFVAPIQDIFEVERIDKRKAARRAAAEEQRRLQLEREQAFLDHGPSRDAEDDHRWHPALCGSCAVA